MVGASSNPLVSWLLDELDEVPTPRVWAGDDQHLWVVVGGSGDELDRLLIEGADDAPEGGLRLCRAILEDGTVVLGEMAPGVDAPVDDLWHGDDGDGH